MLQVGLTISNPTEAMYLNAFALGQNIVLQIMATWVCLSTYLLFVINLSPLKLFNTESAFFRTASIKQTCLKFSGKEIYFSL